MNFFGKMLLIISILYCMPSAGSIKNYAPPEKAPKYILKLLHNHKYDQAINELRNILSKSRDREDSLKMLPILAKCFIAGKEWDSAAVIYKKLSEIDAHYKEWWESLYNIVIGPEYGYKPVHLPKTINSPQNEILPVISSDGKELFFIVENIKTKNQDIYYSKKDKTGRWVKRMPLTTLNTKYSDGVLGIFNNGNALLLLGQYKDDGTKTPGFSISKRINGKWSRPENIKIKGYKTKSKFVSATISNDGNIIIVALDRKEGYGNLDLYYLKRNPDGSYGPPVNLGPDINTPGNDGTPFLASDGVTLYFSSDGHPNLGNGDMFVTRRLDDSWTKWEKPKNLGKELNTIFWDAYYTIQSNGRNAYFSSSGYGIYGGTDIFYVSIPESLRPRFRLVLHGKVVDEKNNPLIANIKYFDKKTKSILANMFSDKKGLFDIPTQSNNVYSLSATADGYDSLKIDIDLRITPADTPYTVNIVLKKKKIPPVLKQNLIHFDFDKYDIRPQDENILLGLLQILNTYPEIKAKIIGHTDSVGYRSYNKKLSIKRAEAVKNWLVAHGISEERIICEGIGEKMPIADNGTAEGMAMNRRAEIILIREEK